MTSRRRVVVGVVAVAVLAGAVTAVLVRRDEKTDVSREAATAYVDLVATAGRDDLPRLWAMTASDDSPAALRDAGALLLGAEDRIDVVSVGDAEPVADLDTAYRVHLEEFRRVEVTYRLDGRELRWPVQLGRLAGSSGDEVDDWRVVDGLGSIDWVAAAAALPTDYYLDGTQLVRRPIAIGSDAQVQPLYPAVYRTQTRQGTFYASQEEPVVVLPGDPVAPPVLSLTATDVTVTRLREQVLSDFGSCRIRGRYTCPVDDLVESLGVDTYGTRWWRGLSQAPTVTLDGTTVTLADGALRYRGPGGVRTVRFTGTGQVGIDGTTHAPGIFEYELEVVR